MVPIVREGDFFAVVSEGHLKNCCNVHSAEVKYTARNGQN